MHSFRIIIPFFYTSVHSSLICSYVLVQLDESCLTYIIVELHSHFNLKRKESERETERQKKKKRPTRLPLHLSISLSIWPGPSVLLSPTPPSHITPLITVRREANQRESVCACVTNPSSIFICLLLDKKTE